METIVIPTAYLPAIAYFKLLSANRMLSLDVNENYIKQTCRNRAYIYSANGVIPLIVPVIKVFGNHTPVHAIEISHSQKWQTNHWRAIESAYQSSPYFLYYKDGLKALYHIPYTRLIDLNHDMLFFLLKATGVANRISFSDRYISPERAKPDMRNNASMNEYGRMEFGPYQQVFDSKFGYISNLSIIDLLFNLGPGTKKYLEMQQSGITKL